MPSLACACAIAARNGSDCSPLASDTSDSQQVSQEEPDNSQTAESSSQEAKLVDVHDTVYVLNPSGDLASTQSTFQHFFAQQRGWQVQDTASPIFSLPSCCRCGVL